MIETRPGAMSPHEGAGEMSWAEIYLKPLWTREEAEEYITTELTHAAPVGWQVEHFSERRRSRGRRLATRMRSLLRLAVPRGMSWRIVRTEIPPEEWPFQAYVVRLSACLEFVTFTHGNHDKGPGPRDRRPSQAPPFLS